MDKLEIQSGIDTSIIQNVNGENLIDSRVLAVRLGYEHKIVKQSISRHRQRLESKSLVLQFEAPRQDGNTGGDKPTYCMLNERQALILTGCLKKGDEAEKWHDFLVDAFLEARQALKTHKPFINNKWEVRAKLFGEKTKIPKGYWAIFPILAYELSQLEKCKNLELIEKVTPDISVGLLWKEEMKRLGLDESLVKAYTHLYSDRAVSAKMYPSAWLGQFYDWFRYQYMQEDFPVYIKRNNLLVSIPVVKQITTTKGDN